MLEYRLECRFQDGEWRPVMSHPPFTGEKAKTNALTAWAWETAASFSRGWEYRIVERTVSEWTPIENMEQALAIARGEEG